jgi:hypothetical protein
MGGKTLRDDASSASGAEIGLPLAGAGPTLSPHVAQVPATGKEALHEGQRCPEDRGPGDASRTGCADTGCDSACSGKACSGNCCQVSRSLAIGQIQDSADRAQKNQQAGNCAERRCGICPNGAEMT